MFTAAKRAVKAVVPQEAWQRFYSRNYVTLRPLIVDHCPVVLPWVRARLRDHPVADLHRIATAPPAGSSFSARHVAITSVACALWPFRLLALAGEELRRNGRAVRQQYGVGLLAQFGRMLRVAVSSNVAPGSFYRFRLFDPENARRAHEYLQADELDGLHAALTSRLPSLDPIDDKELFFLEGRSRGLRVVPVVASFDPERGERWYDGQSLPEQDLILKPSRELSGRGVERWTWDAAFATWRNGERNFGPRELLDHCRSAGGLKKHLLQRRVFNHSALTPLAPGGLATLRVVSYRRPSGQCGIIMSGLRMPTGGQCVDNFAAGGIAAPVDSKGALGTAVAKDPTKGRFDTHPDSGAPIAGASVPYYREALDLTIRAHAGFPWVPTVGWDVVIASDGPLLLEANPSWGFELAQIVPNKPLGATPYAEVFLEHLAAQARSTVADTADHATHAAAGLGSSL